MSAGIVREYGSDGPTVVLIHGGPGAPGYLAPLGRALAGRFRVLEPFQRRSGASPLTVATHVGDLADLVEDRALDRPALVGHSWGAMLALAFAAEYPDLAGPIVLVGCGTFDPAARKRFEDTVDERLGPLRERLRELDREVVDADERLRLQGSLLLPAYSHELTVERVAPARCDAKGYRETWSDVLRLQDEGTHPAAFSAIASPVLMIHGAQDPHPGDMIRASLAPHLARLEYRELARCGHYPWIERHARQPFLRLLAQWLTCPPEGLVVRSRRGGTS